MSKQENGNRIQRFTEWRKAHLTDQQFLLLISIPTGFLAGSAAVVIKTLAHTIRDFLLGIKFEYSYLLYFIFPAIGICLTICFCKYILKSPLRI